LRRFFVGILYNENIFIRNIIHVLFPERVKKINLRMLKKKLVHETITTVKFSEVDSLGIVWHGHYVRYFEDGREAFGNAYGLGYLDIFNFGYLTPVVNVQCDYKLPLRYGSRVKIVSEYIPCEAAKIKFNYKLFDVETDRLVATGHTVQVFLDRTNFVLQLSMPDFYEEWKKKNGLI